MTEEQTTTETKRGRVRRLLIEPLIEHGFRKPGNLKLDAHDAFLDQLFPTRRNQLSTFSDKGSASNIKHQLGFRVDCSGIKLH